MANVTNHIVVRLQAAACILAAIMVGKSLIAIFTFEKVRLATFTLGAFDPVSEVIVFRHS